MRRLILVLIAAALPFTAMAGDDEQAGKDDIGVDEARDLNDAARDAGQKHGWNPGGWGIGKQTRDNDRELSDDDQK